MRQGQLLFSIGHSVTESFLDGDHLKQGQHKPFSFTGIVSVESNYFSPQSASFLFSFSQCMLFLFVCGALNRKADTFPPPFHATKISPVFQLQNYLQSHTYSTIHEASNSERNLVEHKVLLTQRRLNAHIY